LVLLLTETCYLLAGFTCLGVQRLPPRAMVVAGSGLAACCVGWAVYGLMAGADLNSWFVAQPAAGATAVLGWGIGRAARRFGGLAGPATASAMLGAALVGAMLVPVSHLSPSLTEWPRLTAVLLALNPFVAVSASGGFDLVRSDALYEALTISGYRFRYPGPWMSTALPAALGLVLGRLGSRRYSATRRRRPRLGASTRESAA
jgi:hypothetical protein